MTNRELFRVSKKRVCELTSQYYEPVTLKEVVVRYRAHGSI